MDGPALTRTVVEVGPTTVRGPGQVPTEKAAAAVEFVDDDIALVDDEPVPTARLWRAVLRTVTDTPGAPSAVTLVCPTWWAHTRLERVGDAVRTLAPDVIVRRRADLLDADASVVEIAPEFVAVRPVGGALELVPRADDVTAVSDAVAALLTGRAEVVIDAPLGVAGAAAVGAAVAKQLRRGGIDASVLDPDWLLPPPMKTPPPRWSGAVDRPGRIGARTWAVLGGVLAALAGLSVGALLPGESADRTGDLPMMLVTEGRVGALVPVSWRPQRITDGPGSPRLQLVSPVEPRTALHITQSVLPPGQSLPQVAEVLRAALHAESSDVFTDFTAEGRRAGRPAVTYRERRREHHIDWVVLLDGTVRIAIGCQCPSGREHTVAEVCDRAVRSAHAVF